MSHPCDKFESAGHRGGGHCKLHNRTVSVTGCSRCSDNPRPGEIPLINATIALKPIPRKPRVLSPAETARAEARAAICAPCEHNQRLRTTTEKGFAIYVVKCALCKECGGRSLIYGACPAAKWGADSSAKPVASNAAVS